MPCRSLPVPGSVIAIAVMISPVTEPRQPRAAFCSSLASRSRYGSDDVVVQAEADAAVAPCAMVSSVTITL